jgi:hypothetical protein
VWSCRRKKENLIVKLEKEERKLCCKGGEGREKSLV